MPIKVYIVFGLRNCNIKQCNLQFSYCIDLLLNVCRLHVPDHTKLCIKVLSLSLMVVLGGGGNDMTQNCGRGLGVCDALNRGRGGGGAMLRIATVEEGGAML